MSSNPVCASSTHLTWELHDVGHVNTEHYDCIYIYLLYVAQLISPFVLLVSIQINTELEFLILI